jgi:RNA processing factor Prp31
VHRFVVDLYAKKFPELESLVPSKYDYARTVQRIANETVRQWILNPPFPEVESHTFM